MNDGTPLSSSDFEMAYKVKKNRNAAFDKKIKINCYSLKVEYDALFKNMSRRPAFLLRPLKSMLNFEVDRLSFQQLE